MRLLLLNVFLSSLAIGQMWLPTPGGAYPVSMAGWSGLTSCALDGSYNACSVCGSYQNGGQGAKSIRNIAGVASSTMTKSGGSGLVFFLASPSTTNGGPMQPGVEDQTVGMSNSAIPAANQYYETAPLSADRQAGDGDFLCAGARFDDEGRKGTDNIQILRVANNALPNQTGSLPSLVRRTTTTGVWSTSASARLPMIYFKHTDGTYGWLARSTVPALNSTGTNITNASAVREHGLYAVFDQPVRMDAIEYRTSSNNAASEFRVYDAAGNTLRTVEIAATYAVADANLKVGIVPLELAPNQVYRVIRLPTTSSNVTVTDVGVASADWIARLNPGGTFQLTTRDMHGTWTETADRLPMMWLSVTHIGAPAAGGSVKANYPIN
jgi:hypothetical protein